MRRAAPLLLLLFACGESTPELGGFDVPLAPDSPWPKFRRDSRQHGLAPFGPTAGGALWTFPTGKGIFSSPVIGADGTIYIGSADRVFYALRPDGSVRWTFETGEIIDSAALLDDQGRLYFGSGDGHLYALDADTGALIWKTAADDPSVNDAFINWFEGNVAMGADGRLFVPNDNFYIYSVDRDSGEYLWKFEVGDQTWSLPAVDAARGRLYVGNNNLLPILGDNTFALTADGRSIWSKSVLGSIAASPALLDDRVVVGGFDGYVRAYDTSRGDLLWEHGTGDHVYASPAIDPEGRVIQPSADGSVYCIDPADGRVLWAFDTEEPLRSSPAVDADGTIYLGSGEGRLFALNPDGTLRWAMALIQDERNDLNASPALGRDAIYIAGESGEIFSVPYDYCLTAADARCTRGPGELLPAEGATVRVTTRFGGVPERAPERIFSAEALAFTLLVREDGDTALARLDASSLVVTVDPPAELDVEVSGDRRFFTVVPKTRFTPDAGGGLTLSVQGAYLRGFERSGLALTGGERAGELSASFRFTIHEPRAGARLLGAPDRPGGETTVLEVHRLAAPLPTILPSYNQIGFDSLHYLVGFVEGGAGQSIGWFVGALPGPGGAVVDPRTKVMLPLTITQSGDVLTMENREGLSLEVLNAQIGFDRFRISGRVDDRGEGVEAAVVVASSVCGGIELYGAFLRMLGFCNPDSDLLHVFGAALLGASPSARPYDAAALGTPSFGLSPTELMVSVADSGIVVAEHRVGLLLVDAATALPVTLDYGGLTRVTASEAGHLSVVPLPPPEGLVGTFRAYLMIDTHPAAMGQLTLP